MGTFEDFRNSVNSEAMGKLIEELCPPEIISFSTDPEDISAALAHLYKQAVTTACQISMLNLQAYHEWLQTQLE